MSHFCFSFLFLTLSTFLFCIFRWRVVTEADEQEELTVELEQCNQNGESPDDEDISDECLVVNHNKALLEERKKFETYLKFPLTSRSRANRRIDSRGNESSGANTPTPDPTSPAPALSAGDIEVSFDKVQKRFKLKLQIFLSQFRRHWMPMNSTKLRQSRVSQLFIF